MTTIEHIVMKRVHRIYWLRQLFGATALKAYVVIAGFALLGQLVHVASVLSNMPSLFAPSAFAGFWLGALSHTEFSVQLILALLVGTLAFIARDVFQSDVRMGQWRSAH